MEVDFKKLMSGKTEVGLREYITRTEKYVPEAIEAAIAEMQTRGHVFTDEELAGLKLKIQQRQKEVKGQWSFGDETDINLVVDEGAPLFYSHNAIRMFTILFGAFFGSFLLMLNINQTKLKRRGVEVMLGGIAFTSFQILVVSETDTGFARVGWLFNFVAGYLLTSVVWDNYIGKNTKYRAKPVWVPLAIGLSLSALIFWAVLSGRVSI